MSNNKTSRPTPGEDTNEFRVKPIFRWILSSILFVVLAITLLIGVRYHWLCIHDIERASEIMEGRSFILLKRVKMSNTVSSILADEINNASVENFNQTITNSDDDENEPKHINNVSDPDAPVLNSNGNVINGTDNDHDSANSQININKLNKHKIEPHKTINTKNNSNHQSMQSQPINININNSPLPTSTKVNNKTIAKPQEINHNLDEPTNNSTHPNKSKGNQSSTTGGAPNLNIHISSDFPFNSSGAVDVDTVKSVSGTGGSGKNINAVQSGSVITGGNEIPNNNSLHNKTNNMTANPQLNPNNPVKSNVALKARMKSELTHHWFNYTTKKSLITSIICCVQVILLDWAVVALVIDHLNVFQTVLTRLWLAYFIQSLILIAMKLESFLLLFIQCLNGLFNLTLHKTQIHKHNTKINQTNHRQPQQSQQLRLVLIQLSIIFSMALVSFLLSIITSLNVNGLFNLMRSNETANSHVNLIVFMMQIQGRANQNQINQKQPQHEIKIQFNEFNQLNNSQNKNKTKINSHTNSQPQERDYPFNNQINNNNELQSSDATAQPQPNTQFKPCEQNHHIKSKNNQPIQGGLDQDNFNANLLEQNAKQPQRNVESMFTNHNNSQLNIDNPAASKSQEIHYVNHEALKSSTHPNKRKSNHSTHKGGASNISNKANPNIEFNKLNQSKDISQNKNANSHKIINKSIYNKAPMRNKLLTIINEVTLQNTRKSNKSFNTKYDLSENNNNININNNNRSQMNDEFEMLVFVNNPFENKRMSFVVVVKKNYRVN